MIAMNIRKKERYFHVIIFNVISMSMKHEHKSAKSLYVKSDGCLVILRSPRDLI